MFQKLLLHSRCFWGAIRSLADSRLKKKRRRRRSTVAHAFEALLPSSLFSPFFAGPKQLCARRITTRGEGRKPGALFLPSLHPGCQRYLLWERSNSSSLKPFPLSCLSLSKIKAFSLSLSLLAKGERKKAAASLHHSIRRVRPSKSCLRRCRRLSEGKGSCELCGEEGLGRKTRKKFVLFPQDGWVLMGIAAAREEYYFTPWKRAKSDNGDEFATRS